MESVGERPDGAIGYDVDRGSMAWRCWQIGGLRCGNITRQASGNVASVANFNSKFTNGNIEIGDWQHFHIGNISVLESCEKYRYKPLGIV